MRAHATWAPPPPPRGARARREPRSPSWGPRVILVTRDPARARQFGSCGSLGEHVPDPSARGRSPRLGAANH